MPYRKRQLRYRNRVYRSKFEISVAQQLYRKKKRFKYESTKIKYTVPARKATYTPDFILKTRKGKTIYIEVKGRLTSTNRKTYLLVKKDNPEVDLRFIFALNNKLTKVSKTRYSDWAENHGFPYAFKKIPEEWLQE